MDRPLDRPVDRAEYDKLDRLEDSMWWFAATHANLLTFDLQDRDDDIVSNLDLLLNFPRQH